MSGTTKSCAGPGAEAAKRVATTLDAIDAVVVVLDSRGRILLVNQGWWNFARKNRLPDGSLPKGIEVGANYLRACRKDYDDECGTAVMAREGLRRVLRGNADHFSLEYPCHHGQRQRWFRMTARLMHRAEPPEMVVSHVDITDRKLAELALLAKQEELARAAAALKGLSHRIAELTKDSAPRDGGRADPGTSKVSDGVEHGERQAVLDILSHREREVMRGLVNGERNGAIAVRLGLSPKTISTYRNRIFEKLDINSIGRLVALGIRAGMVEDGSA